MSGLLRVHVVFDALGWGGAETLLADFVAGAQNAALDVSVSYLADRDGSPAAERLRRHGVEPQLLAIAKLLAPASERAVRAAIEASKPDVVHAHLSYADFLAGRAARRLGLPVVSTLHVMHPPSGAREQLKDRAISRVRRTHMNAVIAVSERAREAAVDARWATPAQLVTVHNGIVGAARPGAGKALRAQLEIAPGAPVVAMLTVLRPGKGHEAAFAAWPEVRRHVPGAVLLVAGDGPSRPALERAASSVEGVRLLGYRSDVMELLDCAEVLLHPTDFDAFPTVLLEAMAASTAIVATRVGGIPEIVDDGLHARLVSAPARTGDLARALAQLLGDDELRGRLGTAGRRRFEERFTAERWASATRAVYERAISTCPASCKA